MTRIARAWCFVLTMVMAAGVWMSAAGQTKPAAPPRPATRPAASANPVLVLTTAKGVIEIELLRADAPKSVEYIVALVTKGFYRGLRFHRVERMVAQIGDPTSRDVTKQAWWGRTGADPFIGVAEISKRLSHTRGMVGLAHTGNPKWASSQFYIMKTANPELDGKYAIIGRVVAGMAVVDALRVPDVLKLASIKAAGPK